MKKIVFKFILMLGMVMMMISPVYAERLYGTLTTNVPYTEEASPQMIQDGIAETAFAVDGESVSGQTPYLEVDYGKAYMISSVSFVFGNTDGIQRNHAVDSR